MKDRPGFYAIFAVVALLFVFMTTVFVKGEFGVSVTAPSPLTIVVERGESLSSLVQRLSRGKILVNPRFFKTLAVLRGDTSRIKAGDYVLNGAISPNELLDYLVSGRAKFLSITIPEGFSLRDIAQRLEARDEGRGKEFLNLTSDPEFISTLGLKFPPIISTLEGFIFPDTYFFHRGADMSQVIRLMVKEYMKVGQGTLESRAHKVGLTPYQALILASIIEKETGQESERRLISAVFHNRLKIRMRLASDPTVIYGIDAFDGNLTRAHLSTLTRYNTYKIRGLPPTPIANPGIASLEAAVNPARVRYLYFVAKGDGSHYFSKDLHSHNKAVWKYQKRRRNKRRS